MKKLLLALLIVFTAVFHLAANETNFFDKNLPDSLIKGAKKTVDTSKVLKGKMVAIYFSASWCGPCRNFTPKLVKFYKSVAKKEKFEIIFVSSDKNENAMLQYIKKYRMPWLTVPFDAPEREQLKKRFNVTGIPTLIVLDSNGNVISKNARSEVASLGTKAVAAWKAKVKKPKK